MALSVISLLWIDSVAATAIALFGLGLGWNFSFVAATAELADSTLVRARPPDGLRLATAQRHSAERVADRRGRSALARRRWRSSRRGSP